MAEGKIPLTLFQNINLKKIYVHLYNQVCSSSSADGIRVDFTLRKNESPKTCGAYVAPGVWKEFDCYNLAAIGKTTNDDPFTPSWRLIGGYWQWGRKGPSSSQWYNTNTSNFSHGPTGSDAGSANSGSISGWDTSSAPDGFWSDDSKTANDLLCRLFEAYFDARKHKRNTHSQLRFEINYEARLIALCRDILSRNYRILPSIAFIIDKPLKREVFAADFSDRVVHHLLFNMINPVFELEFIDESFSCRVGKGTHYGIHTLNRAIIDCSNHYQQDCYILKLDIGKIYLQHYTRGVNYLGATIKPYRMYVSNRTKNNFRQCVRQWERFLDTTPPLREDLHRMRASFNSYLGLLQHYRAYNIKKEILLDSRPKEFFKYQSMFFYLYMYTKGVADHETN